MAFHIGRHETLEEISGDSLVRRLFGIEKPLLRFDDHAGEEAHVRLAALLEAGRCVAYCSDAGMPGVNDPGFELARLARARGVPVTVLPGASAVTLAVVASGLPTHAFSFRG